LRRSLAAGRSLGDRRLHPRAAALAVRADRGPEVSSYLFAWLLFLGLALGGMANLMLHNLTGGKWGVAVRPTFIAAARLVPLAALLGIPLLIGVRHLYPIAESGWFSAPFLVARSVIYPVVGSA